MPPEKGLSVSSGRACEQGRGRMLRQKMKHMIELVGRAPQELSVQGPKNLELALRSMIVKEAKSVLLKAFQLVQHFSSTWLTSTAGSL